MRQEYLSSGVNVLAKVLRCMITVKQSFSNWLDLEFMWKKDNSGALLVSAVFETG